MPIKKGVGFIFILSGLLHMAGTLLALFYAAKFPLPVAFKLLAMLYYGHFLLMVIGGGLYLFISYWRRNAFYAQPLVDFIIGVGGFIVLFSLTVFILLHRWAGPTYSLAPGLGLLIYGVNLTWN